MNNKFMSSSLSLRFLDRGDFTRTSKNMNNYGKNIIIYEET